MSKTDLADTSKCTSQATKATSGDYLMLTALLYCLVTHARIQFMYLLCIPI